MISFDPDFCPARVLQVSAAQQSYPCCAAGFIKTIQAR
jgi:hypothetical protein